MCHFGIRDFRLWTFSWSTETFEMQSMLLTMQSLDQVCFLQEKEKTGKFCDFWSIFNRFNIWWICLLIQQHFLPLWLFEWYQFKKDSGDTEWITKLIINDRPNCHILYITTMTAVREVLLKEVFQWSYSRPSSKDMIFCSEICDYVRTWTDSFLTKRTGTDVLGKTTQKG